MYVREIRFRAWHSGRASWQYDPVMLYENKPGEVFRWLEEGQPITIMQYTGLKDKNGKEIFEGDIFEAPHDFGPGGFDSRRAVVRFHEERGYQWEYWMLDQLEVLGNVYEHPHLLGASASGSTESTQ